MLGFSSLLPEPAVYEANFGTDSIYFMGLSGARWRWYSYTGGAVRIGAGADPAGGVWVGLVFGPSDWYDGTEWQRIVESFTTYE